MKATVVDLRYRMNDVLKALERNESVSVLHRGRVKGVIAPLQVLVAGTIARHVFFGMNRRGASTDRSMEQLRGGRHRDL